MKVAGLIRPGLATGRTASNAARQAIAGEQKASTKSVSMLSLGCPKNTVDGESPSDGSTLPVERCMPWPDYDLVTHASGCDDLTARAQQLHPTCYLFQEKSCLEH